MELEHAVQQPGFLAALQIMIAGSLLVPAALGRISLYQRFAAAAAGFVVTLGPLAILLYVLYKVSRLS